MLAFAMAKVMRIFYRVVTVVHKEEGKRIQ